MNTQLPRSRRTLAVALAILVASPPLGRLPPAPPAAGEKATPSQDGASWMWPTASPSAVVRGFENPPTRYAAGHRGVDIGAQPGSVVVAPAAGTVHFAGTVVDRGIVSIDHGGGVLSSLEPVTPLVERGAIVSAGTPVAVVATSAHCPACIHLGARIDGEYVSPLRFLGGIERAVLLPLGRRER